jgi:hypothetical protein
LGEVIVARPAGWVAQAQGEGLVLQPALASGPPLSVLVFASRAAPAKREEGLDILWREAGKRHRILQRAAATEVIAADGVAGLASVGVVESNGQRLSGTVAAYSAKGRLYGLLIVGDERAVLTHGAALRGLLGGLRLDRGPEALAAPRTAYALIVRMGRGASTQPGAGWIAGSETAASALFTDGTYLRAVPAEGLDGIDATARRLRSPSDFGRYDIDAVSLRLQAFDRVETLERQHDGTYLRRESPGKPSQPRETRYFEAPSIDGVKLEGRYGRFGQADSPQAASIVFRPDGTFDDRGIVAQLTATEYGVRHRDAAEVAHPGTGRYRAANHTLFLDYADGRRKRVLFVLTPDEAGSPRPAALYFGAWCVRRP